KDRIEIDRMTPHGQSSATLSLARKKGGSFLSLVDLSADADGNLYLLLDVIDVKTDRRESQRLDIYNLDRLFSKRLQSHVMAPEDGRRYRWVDAAGQVVLMATDAPERTLYREAFDTAALLSGNALVTKGARAYPLAPKDGVVDVVAVGANVAYRSRSGKVFLASENAAQPRELYSALLLQEATYPIFIAPENSERILLGVQESGDILSMSLADGSTTVVKNGGEPFSGVSRYKPLDVRAMSMLSLQDFTAAAANGRGFDLVVSHGGAATVVSKITPTLLRLILHAMLQVLGWFAILALAGELIYSFFYVVSSSRTILLKLLFASIPLLVMALTFFGIFSYSTYSASISQSFEKQVTDEGSLLRALFGTESFAEIEYPYQYTSESYAYLRQNMNTRSIYTSTAYYERQALFIGVDESYPCAYPFDVRLDAKASELYRQAAYTGQAQTGVLNDASGKRLVCITPIGGDSGAVVYLLETGIPIAGMTEYTNAYLRSYLVVALLFVVGIALILALVFRRILHPIGEIQSGLEEFSRGKRSVRLTDNATDEFSDIIRVFNKMANDIDAQIFSLKQASETYFRFIPQQMLQMLGKENLGDVELGGSMEQDCSVLCISLGLRCDNLTRDEQQTLTNRFFNIVNLSCDQNGATLMPDSVSLRRLRVLCPNGANSAVDLALSALSRLDALNATLPVQNRLDALFVVHRAPSYYGICGDENRLVPALISDEMDRIMDCEKALRALSSRLIVTENAFAEI
ncbi:MAG: HAMP domain-containing protein, partial [Oscillospiraceae bacterium]